MSCRPVCPVCGSGGPDTALIRCDEETPDYNATGPKPRNISACIHGNDYADIFAAREGVQGDSTSRVHEGDRAYHEELHPDFYRVEGSRR